ncbi:MAG: N-methyl-L-tryptophan oxidase [Planctomycetaceae bacterium]
MIYDVIVIGTGGIGSAVLYELARRGANVLGLDRFPPGHNRGSSHGQSRIIRRSYFEHPDYVPLLHEAYRLWDEFCERRFANLLHRTGLLYSGQPNGAVIQGVLNSAKQHRLTVEQLSPADAAARFPGFRLPDDSAVLFEADAGYLLVEECVKAFIEEATRFGAEAKHGETVIEWFADPGRVTVRTNSQAYKAERLVITSGCWANDLLADLKIPLKVILKHLHWFEPDDDRYFESNGCPCFFVEALDGYFYGFPTDGVNGVKVAEHSGGVLIHDPLTIDRREDSADTQRVSEFLKRHLPGVSSRRRLHDVCFYTMSPDEHFIVDRHPQHDSVCFAAGMSGHAFKFASVLGRVLAELAMDGQPSLNVDFLNLRRPGLQR